MDIEYWRRDGGISSTFSLLQSQEKNSQPLLIPEPLIQIFEFRSESALNFHTSLALNQKQ
jgi:hypothetical protein